MMTLRFFGYVALSLIVLLALIWLYVKFQENWGIFHPRGYEQEWFERVPRFKPDLEPVEFKTSDGVKLTGIWRSGEPGQPALIFFHGNAGNITSRLWWFDLVVPDDWSALLFDYRGYGLSGGSPSEPGLYRDVEAALDFVEQRHEGPLVLHGKSLGTVMAARGCQETEVAGLVLESGFPDAVSMAHTILPLPGIRYFMNVRMRLVDYVHDGEEKFGAFPRLVIHGGEDRIVPFQLGRSLYEQLPEPKQKWFIDSAGHNDLVEVAGEAEYSRSIRRFLTETVETQGN